MTTDILSDTAVKRSAGTDDTVPDVAAQMYGETQNPAPAAGEQNADETSFETLIRTKYKDEFGKKVSEIVRSRLKNQKQEDALKDEAYAVFCKRLDIDPCDEKAVRDALTEHGISDAETETIRKQYPDFSMDEEKQNRLFSRLISFGIDPKTAYETVHLSDIIASACRRSEQEAEKRVMDKVALNANRPSESGLHLNAAGLGAGSVSQMTDSQISDICRRVSRGERIILK